MKRSTHVNVVISFVLLLTMLSPVSVLAFDKGKDHFKEGMKFEAAQQWDKAVEEFALAVSDSPKNPEYRLHLTRSLFHASQMFMKKGNTAAQEKDYEGAYVAFRRAYAFDPTNELAKSEMDRMVRMQQGTVNGGAGTSSSGVNMVPTGYVAPPPVASQIPQRLEKLRDIPFPSGIDAQQIIKELAKELDLNVLFDKDSFGTAPKKVSIELKNVTAAQALDYIFLQEGFFFQRVGPRTIIVANQAQRSKFQQLVLRTFYLANAAPKDIIPVIQTAIPAQPGRTQTTVLKDDATNSVTVRDTEENIRLIGKLIASLDKDRAEVVMDVAIYEVNKTDLMKFGNQIGNQAQLNNLGGSSPGLLSIGRTNIVGAAAAAAATGGVAIPTAIATGIILPGAYFSAFQNRSDTKLLASTQIHAFNNEDSSARIGQRVPVRSATFQTGVAQQQVGGNGVVSDVINYEQIGLTLKFRPIVFPNQDVQVAMEIESKDVAGAQTLTPTFTERTIKGTARIQNNKTLLLASVAQDVESKGREGLPFLGGLPWIGRLFTAPTNDNRQVDIVIAVTPRVIRAPNILPDDEIERPTGSMAVPTNSSLEAMIIEEERQENIAAARRLGNTAVIQRPDRPMETPTYVQASTTTAVQPAPAGDANAQNVSAQLKPIDSSVKTLQLTQTSDTVKPEATLPTPVDTTPPAADQASPASVDMTFGAQLSEMKAGEKIRLPIMVQGNGPFRSAVVGLKFDDKKVAVRGVSFGDVFGAAAASQVAVPFLNQNGKMYISLSPKDNSQALAAGTLAFVEIEALVAGKPEIVFDRDVVNFLTAEGKNFAVKLPQ